MWKKPATGSAPLQQQTTGAHWRSIACKPTRPARRTKRRFPRSPGDSCSASKNASDFAQVLRGSTLQPPRAARRLPSFPRCLPAPLTSGKEAASLLPPPLRTVRASLPAYGSSKPAVESSPQMARLLIAGVLALFAALQAASNIHQDEPSLPRPMTGPLVARQHPFGLGIGPIQQLMVSLCLSAAGLRFLQPPVPAEDLALPYGRVSDPKVRPQRGCPVPHP